MAHQDWKRLGELLVQRRVALGYPVRTTWARDVLKLGNDRIQADLENARRTNYEPATLARAELQYGWQPGSIAAVLAGGDPTPIPGDALDRNEAMPRRLAAGHDMPAIRKTSAQVDLDPFTVRGSGEAVDSAGNLSTFELAFRPGRRVKFSMGELGVIIEDAFGQLLRLTHFEVDQGPDSTEAVVVRILSDDADTDWPLAADDTPGRDEEAEAPDTP